MPIRLLALLVCVWALIACEEGQADPRRDKYVCHSPNSTETAIGAVFCADPSTMQRVPVVRVIDGDTIRVLVDDVEEPVRFYGIDTPERGEACYPEATDRAEELVDNEVLLVRDARDQDRNGRLLRYVYTPAGLSVDAVLIHEGYARAWEDDGALRHLLVELERRAREEHVGCLWSR